jgi:hypothetical protein
MWGHYWSDYVVAAAIIVPLATAWIIELIKKKKAAK